MRHPLRYIFVMTMPLCLVHCGRRGAPTRSLPLLTPSPSPKPSTAPSAPIGFGLFAAPTFAPDAPSCSTDAAPLPIAPLPSPLAIDGDLGEWEGTPALASSEPSSRVVSLKLAADDHDVALAISLTELPPGRALVLSWSGILQKNGHLQETIVRRLRIQTNGSLADGSSGTWVPVDHSESAIMGHNIELRFDRHLVADALAWPVWGLHAYTVSDTLGPSEVDALSGDGVAFYRVSALDGDDPAFTLHTCQLASRDEIEDIAARNVDAAQAFSLFRAALANVQALFQPLQVPSPRPLAVIAAPAADEDGEGDAAARLDTSLLDANALVLDGRERVYLDSSRWLLRHYLKALAPEAPIYLRTAVETSLQDLLTQKVLKPAYWLIGFPTTVQALLAAPSEKVRLPLPTLAAQADPLVVSKAMGFGHLLAGFATSDVLIRAWQEAGQAPRAAFDGAFKDALQRLLRPSDRVARLWSGWMDEGAFDPAFAPAMLGDADEDGIPAYYEQRLGTRDDRTDSDGDGWSDYAELVAGSDPSSAASTPRGIVSDGTAEDWLELIPVQLAAGQRIDPACSRGADLTRYAALLSPERLLIAGLAASKPEKTVVKWEASVDFEASGRRLLLTALAGDRFWQIKDGDSHSLLKQIATAMPLGIGSMEWVLDLSSLGLTAPDPKGVHIQMHAYQALTPQNNADEAFDLCSETPWFSPLNAP